MTMSLESKDARLIFKLNNISIHLESILGNDVFFSVAILRTRDIAKSPEIIANVKGIEQPHLTWRSPTPKD
ncbi:hypothetical protein Avbf_12474 [Armadillidium vulgare]|nr:hypothetical protein Avbf_12474 [Armadillidium vulgare]